MRIMAIDPGGTTGIATAEVWLGDGASWLLGLQESLEVEQAGTPQEDFAALRIFYWMCEYRPDVVVIEDFRLFPHTAHGPDPMGTIADRYLARLDLLMYLAKDNEHGAALANGWEGCPIEKQMPGERTVVTDEWLRSNGLWRKGKPHAMDALRHLVVYCRKLEKGKK